MTKFKNKYRIETARAKWWDYSGEGSYFITICTEERKHVFGEIINGEMHLSRTGVIADVLWREIPNRNKNVKLGEFVVMPNHIHGVVDVMGVDDADGLVSRRDVARNVSTGNQTIRVINPHHINNPMNMIRHHDKFPQFYVFIAIGDFTP